MKLIRRMKIAIGIGLREKSDVLPVQISNDILAPFRPGERFSRNRHEAGKKEDEGCQQPNLIAPKPLRLFSLRHSLHRRADALSLAAAVRRHRIVGDAACHTNGSVAGACGRGRSIAWHDGFLSTKTAPWQARFVLARRKCRLQLSEAGRRGNAHPVPMTLRLLPDRLSRHHTQRLSQRSLSPDQADPL